MKHRTKNALREMARQFGLKVKFVDYLTNKDHGKLLPREKRILINAHKPRYEHIYTLLHEIAHFVLHIKNPFRKHHPRFFDINWSWNWLANLCSKVRRYMRFIFNKESGKEWEADLWAMCAFVLLAKITGCRDELRVFLQRHPKKLNQFRLVKIAVFCAEIKARCAKARQAYRAALA